MKLLAYMSSNGRMTIKSVVKTSIFNLFNLKTYPKILKNKLNTQRSTLNTLVDTLGLILDDFRKITKIILLLGIMCIEPKLARHFVARYEAVWCHEPYRMCPL